MMDDVGWEANIVLYHDLPGADPGRLNGFDSDRRDAGRRLDFVHRLNRGLLGVFELVGGADKLANKGQTQADRGGHSDCLCPGHK